MRQSLTVLVKPTLTDMTTVNAVSLELDDTSDRMFLRGPSLISQASWMIRKYIGRELARQQVIETFTWELGDDYRGIPQDYLLTGFPIVSIDGVICDGTTWTTDDYWVNLDTGSFGAVKWGIDTSVTYTFGWIMPSQPNADLPPDLERACIDTVSALWHRPERGDPMIRMDRVEGVGLTSYFDSQKSDGMGLPQSVLAILESYRAVK
jgi:hypothetical protein